MKATRETDMTPVVGGFLQSDRPQPFWKNLIVVLLAGCVLAWPAAWNGFPLVFYDTSSYVARSAAIVKRLTEARPESPPPPAAKAGAAPAPSATQRISANPLFLRPIFYSIWLTPLSTWLGFFLIPLCQGVLSAYVVRRTLICAGAASLGAYACAIGVLALGSSLPWHVSYVMPDFITGLVIAMAYVMFAAWPTRSWPGRLFDTGLAGLMIAMHLSHVPLALALIGACALAGLLARRNLAAALRAGGGVAALAVSLLLAVTALVGSNLIAGGKATLSESSPLFLLARLIGDGPARAYLAQACTARSYVLCGERGQLDKAAADGSISDYFLWSDDGPVKRLAGPQLLEEAAEINLQTIRAYPLEVLGAGLRNGARQLVEIQIDGSLNTIPPPFLVQAIAGVDPGLRPWVLASRQAHSGFPLEILRRIGDSVLALCLIAAAVVVAVRRERIPPQAWQFVVVIAIGLVANAFVTGGLSEVHDRYQNRVLWLVVLWPVVLALSRRPQDAPPLGA